MNPLKSLLLALVITACACAPVQDELPGVTTTINDVADRLVSDLGIDDPVWVLDSQALNGTNLLGRAYPEEGGYIVLIRADLNDVQKWMVLEHELAHVLVWEQGLTESGHGQKWGIAFARVHRVATGE